MKRRGFIKSLFAGAGAALVPWGKSEAAPKKPAGYMVWADSETAKKLRSKPGKLKFHNFDEVDPLPWDKYDPGFWVEDGHMCVRGQIMGLIPDAGLALVRPWTKELAPMGVMPCDLDTRDGIKFIRLLRGTK